MIVIVWTYRVPIASRAAFIAAYGPEGDWVKLFQRSPEYRGTELLDDGAGQFATLDRWTSKEAFDRFKQENAAAYEAIDAVCADLTEDETLVGVFRATR